MPALWVGTARLDMPGAADSDSAGNYTAGEFAVRGPQFWLRADRIEAAFVGSSHMANGVLPANMKAVKGQLLAFAGSGVFDENELLENYVFPHAPHLKVIALGIMVGWLYEPVENPARSPWWVWKNSPGGVYDRNHSYWKAGFPTGFNDEVYRRLQTAPEVEQFDSTGGQFVRTLNAGWASGISTSSPISNQDSTNPYLEPNLALLEELVANSIAKGLKVVLVQFPESPQYASMDLAGRYGPSWPEYHRIMARLKAWEQRYPGMVLMDEHKDGKHDYTDEESANTDHLNLKGATKFTARFDSLIKGLLEQ